MNPPKIPGYYPKDHAPLGSSPETLALFSLPNPHNQTREALIKILKDLSPQDQFNLIVFSGEANQWKQSLVQATEENLKEAIDYASKIHAQGGECQSLYHRRVGASTVTGWDQL